MSHVAIEKDENTCYSWSAIVYSDCEHVLCYV